MDTLAGVGGCDSIVSVEVNLFDSVTTVQQLSCYEYESPSGNHTWTESGIYTDTLINFMGCDSVLKIDLSVEDCSCEMFIPNAFTPNGDGLNDVLFPIGACEYSNYEFVVYSREGKRIFVSTDSSRGWSGHYMSQPAPSGPYIYSITYVNELSGYVLHYGTVIIIK